MSYEPNNVSRLESELYRHGFRGNGYAGRLHRDANEEGHRIYDDVMTMGFATDDPKRKCSFDFSNRYSEKAVEMRGYVRVDRLMALCQAIVDTHKSMSRVIKVDAIVTVSTAVAVCEAMRGWRGEDE